MKVVDHLQASWVQAWIGALIVPLKAVYIKLRHLALPAQYKSTYYIRMITYMLVRPAPHACRIALHANASKIAIRKQAGLP